MLKRQAALPHRRQCDTRGVQIQSQDAVAAFTAMLDNPPPGRAGSPMSSMLHPHGMQIRRPHRTQRCRLFPDTAEAAEAWLPSPGCDPALPGARPATPALSPPRTTGRRRRTRKNGRDRAAHGVGAAMIRR